MKKEDITYAQLMARMGIIGMNKFLVNRGIDLIRTHSAPKAKPWIIRIKKLKKLA